MNTNRNEPSDEKKDTTAKKKMTTKKKNVITGVWPCKINGCNKQFAREADLKRHQRTTKLHSMPSFACPQCDATFTRTDALRRHQKSRHNGVVIEPSEKDDADDDGSSGSQSKSRSATPSSKGKEKAFASAPYPAPTTTRTGPSPYYRQHTLTTGPYVPPRQIVMNPHYPQVGLPTSATRMNMATHWGYPPPWPDGTNPQQMSYHQFYLNSHYREVQALLAHIPPPTVQNPLPNPNSDTQPPRAPASGPLQDSHDTSKQSTSTEGGSVAPTLATQEDGPEPIDPSLNSHESTELTAEQIMQITKALLQDQGERSRAESSAGTASTAVFSKTDGEPGPGAQDESRTSEDEVHVDTVDGYEHMLTEDGEPMLNPAELLTQESLASPPPS
ncbi:hypothetical protein E4T56_gene16924 [Termitomyces sp. T112]|nr:hypothetical protein E4T56_gene16924 [Termitomyces sp. T112]